LSSTAWAASAATDNTSISINMDRNNIRLIRMPPQLI
jgi:hypothetical protein